MGLQRQADGNKKGDLEGGGENGSHVDWLGWEVGRVQETFLYGEVGTTVKSEMVLVVTPRGGSLIILIWLPPSVSAWQTLVGFGLPPMGVPLGLRLICGRHLSGPSAQPWMV